MRIEKVEVSAFRGLVGPLSVAFEAGLNVVHGPNEIGKTTLAKAIWHAMALGAKGNTEKHRSLKTHDGTEAPQVTLTLRDGTTSYEVAKIFGSKGAIKLTVRDDGQITEELTADPADERLRELLGIGPSSRGAVSKEGRGSFLLSWVRQGDSGKQPGERLNAGSRESIQAHLAKMTGEALVGEQGTRIYEAVAREYDRYFTKTGEKSGADAPLKNARDAATTAKAELDDLLEQQEAHGVVVQQQESTRTKLDTAQDKTSQIKANRVTADKRLAELERIASERALRQQAHEVAIAAHGKCTDDRKRRGDLRKDEAAQAELAKQLTATIAERDVNAKRLTDDIDERQHAVTAKKAELADLKRRRDDRRALAKLAAGIASLEALQSRYDDAQTAQSLQAKAQAQVDALLVTSKDVEALEALDRDARERRIKLEAAAANIELVRHGEVAIRIDGATVEGSVGELIDRTITTPTTIEVDDLISLTIRPGGMDSSSLEADAERAEAELAGKLEHMKVDSISGARTVDKDRQQAEQDVRQHRQAVALHAPDGLSELGQALETTRATVDLAQKELEDAGVDVGPASATSDADRAGLDAAAQASETEVQTASDDLQALLDGVAGLNSELAEINVQLAADRANRKNAADTASQIRETLAAEMVRDGDDAALDSAIGEAAIRVQATAKEVANIDEQLAAGALEGARQDLEDAQRAVETNADEIKRLDNRASELAGQLRETNMVGIHERIADAIEAKDHADRTLERVEADAEAARLLFETLTKHKSATEQRFRAPLEKSIQNLVRLLWPDARITLDEDFHIAAIERPNKLGRDDFKALSAGASEQLGLVARLAMAQILAEQQPLLVLLDDSLVVTDDDRFKDMARVINRVADKVQIIFLTCHWNRQSGLGLSPHNVIDMEDLVRSAAVQPAG